MPELGIRLTLGASPRELSWLLLRQTMIRVFAGLGVGLISVWWLASWLRSLLFEVRPHDLRVFAGVAGLLVLTSLAAILIPVQKIRQIDPAQALRTE
jgi:putative ABC transport system permease protein